MRKHILVGAMVVVFAAVLAAGFASAAQAVSWTDLPDSVLASYGITNDQVAQISQGFGNGLWRPEQQITRGQFAKMACIALRIAQKSPATPTFADVRPGTTYYSYVEGAAAAGLVHGVSAGRFAPDSNITREQGLAIIARAVALATSQDLSSLYTAPQISSWLGSFSDGSSVSPTLRSAVAFATNLGIVKAEEGDLSPRGWLTRIEAAVFLTRARAPSVASVTPGQGSAAGGDTVTIAGTGFADATTVKFGSSDAESFGVVSNTQISAVVPEGTVGQTVNVVVTNPEGSSAVWDVTFTYTYPIPIVTLVSPAYGSPTGGNAAVITGTGFAGATAVQFGGTDATSYTVVSDTQITAVVPQGTAGSTVAVTVVGPGGTSATNTVACSYTYSYPAVTSVNPDHGPASGGNTVTINGIGFANLTGTDAVRFGGNNAISYQVQSDTKLTAVVPQGTPGAPVIVSVAGEVSVFPVYYTYDEMSLTSVSPDEGEFGGGNTVTITGSGLSEVKVVYFDGLPSPSFSVMSDTRITAMVPAYSGADTSSFRSVNVSVVNFAGDTDTLDDAYRYDVPTVNWLSDLSDAPINSGWENDTVIIHGIGFNCGKIIAVYFGSTLAKAPAFPVSNSDPNSITVTVPAGTSGDTVNVVVVNSYGASAEKVTFKYN